MRAVLMRRAVPLLALAGLLAACSTDSGPNGPPPIVGAVAVSAGWDGTCAIGTSGGLACWGAVPTGTAADTSNGGPDALGATTIPTPIDLIGVSLVRGWASGTGCATGSDHQVYCWGSIFASDFGYSIGIGIQPLAGFTSMNSVATGQFTICGTRTDNGVRCVGWFTGGGRGTDSLATPDNFDFTPNALHPATAAFATAVGDRFGCALRSDSLVACWGMREEGRLGRTAVDTLQNCGIEAPAWCQPGPAPVAGGAKYRQVAVGSGTAVCATRIDGGVDCWGHRPGVTATGPLNPDGTCSPLDACLYVPTAIPLPGTAIRVVVGLDHACALLSTGAAYCWGDNSFGQLGRTGASSVTPVAVSKGYKFVTLSAGANHTCGIELGTGAVGCWGNNDLGQLGDGSTTPRDHPVVVVARQ